jgi:pantetheine-phosphate adenylyltransferase
MKTAIYALSADPITKGHLNIIQRSAKMFDKIIVAIGNNDRKQYMFEQAERKSMVRKAIKTLPKKIQESIEVHQFKGALADFAFEHNASVIVRGLRNVNDFQAEQDLANINKSVGSGDLETCFILTEANQSAVSSSASKEIIKNHYFGDDFLPVNTKVALQKKINNQAFIGITGLMGSGKSHIATQLENASKRSGVSLLNLDLDLLCHEVYNEENVKFAKEREELIANFGTLERSVIGKKAFEDPLYLNVLNSIFKPVIEYQVREKSKDHEGIVLINGATIVSMGYLTKLCNNRIIMVEATPETRIKRCQEGRNIEEEVIEARDKQMLTYKEQYDIINEQIQKDNFGFVISVDNNDNKFSLKSLLGELDKKQLF